MRVLRSIRNRVHQEKSKVHVEDLWIGITTQDIVLQEKFKVNGGRVQIVVIIQNTLRQGRSRVCGEDT